MRRREFLTGAGLGVAAGALAGLRPAAVGRASVEARADDWGSVRAQFNLGPDHIYLGGLLLASHPWPVREAIEAHRRGLDENPVHYLREQGPRLEAEVGLSR